jgi:5-methylcytosine-specific restriction endonuclease McrA
MVEMTRRRLSRIQRAALFKAHAGICHLCGGRIGVGEAWQADHVIPLALGGTDMAPAHVKCHARKTPRDIAAIAKAKRRELRHLGIGRSGRPMLGSRASGWKRHLDGTWSRRE